MQRSRRTCRRNALLITAGCLLLWLVWVMLERDVAGVVPAASGATEALVRLHLEAATALPFDGAVRARVCAKGLRGRPLRMEWTPARQDRKPVAPAPLPRVGPVTALEIARRAFAAESTAGYSALQRYSYTLYGRNVRRSIRVTKRPDGPTLPQPEHSIAIQPAFDPVGRLALQNYVPILHGEDRVVGRDAWSIRLKPRWRRAPWKQIWVDKASGIVLASRDWNAGNVQRASMKTLSVRPGLDRFRGLAQPCHGQARVVPALTPRWVPRGFRVVSVGVDQERGCAASVYSDGLYTITVAAWRTASMPNRANDSCVRDFGQGLIVVRTVGEWSVAALGDLEAGDLDRIARSVR